MATTKKNNTKKGCPVGQAWDISLGRCVDIDDDTQSLFGYSLKGGMNWFGEDSPSDTMFSGTKNYKKEREAAAAKAAAAKKTPPKKVGGSIGTKMKTGGIKKMKDGGKTGAQLKEEGAAMKAKGQAMKLKGKAMKADGIKKKELGMYIKNNPFRAKLDKAITGEYIPYIAPPFKKGGMVKKTIVSKKKK